MKKTTVNNSNITTTTTFAKTPEEATNIISAIINGNNTTIDQYDLMVSIGILKNSCSPSEDFDFIPLAFEGLYEALRFYLAVDSAFNYNSPVDMENVIKNISKIAYLCGYQKKRKKPSKILKEVIYSLLNGLEGDIGCFIDYLPYPQRYDESVLAWYEYLKQTLWWIIENHF